MIYRSRSLGLFALFIPLAGCTVVPTVQYRIIKSPGDMIEMTDAFYRARSEIVVTSSLLSATKPASGAESSVLQISVASNPIESKDAKLGIRAVTNWRSSTVVNITKTENTDLVKAIGVEVTDNTAKNITAYGGAIVKIAGLAAADAAPLCVIEGKPITISVPTGTATGTLKASGSDGSSQCISLVIGPLPIDAIKADDLPQNSDTHNFYYSACRDVEVTVDPNGKQRTVQKVRIADPAFVQYVQFPPKGSITMHSQCGVSVKTDAVSTDSGAAILEALATQGKAIKDAIDAAKK